jgi:hypothetical protein
MKQLNVEDRFEEALADLFEVCEMMGEEEVPFDPAWEPCEADIQSIELVTMMLQENF